MDFKQEYNMLVEFIRKQQKPDGERFSIEDIAKRLRYNRSYFSTLRGKNGEINEDHLIDFKKEFATELENPTFWKGFKDDFEASIDQKKVKAKILSLHNLFKISQSDFLTSIGKVDEFLENITREGVDIDEDLIDTICDEYPQLNREWLLYNKLPKLISQKDDLFKIDDIPTDYLSTRRNLKNYNAPYMVPFFPVKAQAGYVKAIDQQVYMDTLEKYALPPGVQPGGANFAYWEIEGDSMEDTFFDKDIILTSEVHHMDWDNLRNFYVYVIVTTEGVLIKRLFCKNEVEWVLISENEKKYDQQLLPVEYVKQVWVYRKTWATRAKPPKMYEIKV